MFLHYCCYHAITQVRVGYGKIAQNTYYTRPSVIREIFHLQAIYFLPAAHKKYSPLHVKYLAISQSNLSDKYNLFYS